MPNAERIEVEKLSDTFTAVTLTYGFMETPDVVEQGLANLPQARPQCRSRRHVVLPVARVR